MEKKTIADIEPISAAINAKIAALQAPLANREWKFRILPPGEDAAVLSAPGYDDADWPVVTLSHSWSSLDGDAWFRTVSQLPAEVEGIAVAGSQIEMEVFLAIGASIYLDGVERYREPSWTDSRPVPLHLVDDYQPGTPLQLAVRANGGDGFGLFIRGQLRASKLADAVWALDLINAQLTFTRYLVERAAPAARRTLARAWEHAAAALRLDRLAANDWPAWNASVEAARAALAPFAELARTYTAYCVAHSHIDMNWLWPMAETVDVCRRDFATMDKLMAQHPEYRFSQSQAATYAMTEQAHPEIFERIKQRVAEGRWEITANTWVENDLNMASSEAMARQMLHTRRYTREKFGVSPLICWEPDTFGHPATIPQLLAQAGIKYYYFCRAGKRHPLFWWEGPDGSRVLGVQDPRGYGGDITASNIAGATIDFTAPTGTHSGLFVYGAGDHGGGGTARDIKAALRLDAEPFLPHVCLSAATTFYEASLADLKAAGQPGPDLGLPVVRGELNTVFEGCYTSHADIKRLNRASENGLLSAEAVATLAALLTGADYPAAALADAWKTTCFHQFHDILCGCAIGVTYREADERLSQVLATAGQVTAGALAALSGAVETGAGHGPRLVVFNPLAWERDDVVRLPAIVLGAEVPLALVDDAGHVAPAQLIEGADGANELVFVAKAVPGFGVRVYRAADPGVAVDMSGLTADPRDNSASNGILSLRVNARSGALDRLVDLAAGIDTGAPPSGWGPEAKVNAGMLNRLHIYWEQPHPMSAWNIGDITRVDSLIAGAEVRVVESGPVAAVIEVKRRFLNSAFTQRIHLYRGLRRIDFRTEVDWHERGSAHSDAPMLRTTFAPFLDKTTATFEVPFGAVERAADGREVPALRWADLSEVAPAGRGRRVRGSRPTYGISLLNDCKYGYQAHGNTLGLTLVRASYEPDVNPDEGLHRFTYALYPHPGDWREAGTVRRAAELNQPLLAVATDAHDGQLKPGQSWLACEGEAAVVSALKLAEDQPGEGRAVVVRLYAQDAAPADVRLRPAWPVAGASETDPIEQPQHEVAVRRGEVGLALKPYEIKTVVLR
jgi:alpha-mannosidase